MRGGDGNPIYATKYSTVFRQTVQGQGGARNGKGRPSLSKMDDRRLWVETVSRDRTRKGGHMSLTKRIWIDRDPAHEDVRRKYAEEAAAARSQFTFRLATRRRNRLASRPHWDPLWSASLDQAAKELKIDAVYVNDGMFFRTAEDRDAVELLAKSLWDQMAARFKRPRGDGLDK